MIIDWYFISTMVADKFGRVNHNSLQSTMSIDKFGRHGVSMTSTVNIGKPAIGFHLTVDGDYDMKGKLVTNVGYAKSNTDAVSKKYLDNACITKGNNTNYDAKNKLIRNVQQPLMADDVVTKRYFEKEALVKNFDGHYDAGEKRIVNLRQPLQDSDAATMGYVKNGAMAKTEDGNYNLQMRRIVNVGDPVIVTDAASAKYVQSQTPKQYEDHWDFYGKRISNVGDPLYDGEVVNFKTLKRMSPWFFHAGKPIDVSNVKIIKLADATEETDAVNLKVVRQEISKMTEERDRQMSRFGSVLFNYIHRASAPPPEKHINKDNYIDWDKVRSKKEIN